MKLIFTNLLSAFLIVILNLLIMKKLVLFFGLSLFIFSSNAQNSEPIQIINGKFYQNDVRLRIRTVKETVKPIPTAYQEVQIGGRRLLWGEILVISGTVFTCAAIYELLGVSHISDQSTSKGDVWTGLAVGIGITIPGYLLIRNGSQRLVHGVDNYNSSLKLQSAPKSASINIGLTNHGIGLIVRF